MVGARLVVWYVRSVEYMSGVGCRKEEGMYGYRSPETQGNAGRIDDEWCMYNGKVAHRAELMYT